MLYSRTISILISILLFGSLLAQSRIGDWTIHSSTLKITDMMVNDNEVFCATEGGLLVYNFSIENFKTFTKLDGLEHTSIRSIAKSIDGSIWIGGSSPVGFVQVFRNDLNDTGFIFEQGLTSINELAPSDSISFGLFTMNQEFGIVKFDNQSGNINYLDVFKNWPAGITQINSITLLGDSIFLGTNKGVIYADFIKSNLKDPRIWSFVNNSRINDNSRAVDLNGNLIISSGDSLYKVQQDGKITSFLISEENSTIDMVADTSGVVWLITDKALYKFDGSKVRSQISISKFYPNSVDVNNDKVLIGTDLGLMIYNPAEISYTMEEPNTLLSNDISAIKIKSDGRIIAGSRYGLSILESWGWRNIVSNIKSDFKIHDKFDENRFAADTIPVHFGNFIADIEEGPNGKIYCAIRGTYPEPRLPGGGIVIIDIDNPQDVTLIDTTHLDYLGDNYLVVKDLEFDNNGALWVADAYATTKNIPIHKMNINGSWVHYPTSLSQGLGLTPNSLAFDSYNRLWIGSFRDNPINGSLMDGGLTMTTFSNSNYEFDEVLSHSDNTMRTVWSVDISKNDRLYALSPGGLIIMDLQSSNSSPVYYRNPYMYFSNIPFGEGSKVKLDPRENAWVLSSSDGIHVLMNNTSYWPDDDPDLQIEKIGQDNTPLLSDRVTGIDFNIPEGIAAISTARGVNTLKIPFSEKIKDMSKIKIYPSPYKIPAALPMIITGLMDNSSVKIMSLTGEVYRSIEAGSQGESGYQLKWDGRNESGVLLGTGVYLVAIYEPGGKTIFEKIAVIQN